MILYAKVINDVTKICEVGIGTNDAYYISLGMIKQDVEQSYDGQWYLKGYAPQKPNAILIKEYEVIIDKLNNDMLRDLLIITDDEQTAEKKQEAKQYLAQKKSQKNELIEQINKLREV